MAEYEYIMKMERDMDGIECYIPKGELIRCKDCGHWDTTWQNDFAPNYHYCSLIDGTRRGDFYCADAERRGEQDGKNT